MHLSMHNWMRAEPVELTIRRLARYGYESIEISGEPDTLDAKEVRRLLKENKLRSWGAVTLMLGERNLPARDEAQGVRLAVEPLNRFETYFINRGAQALALAEATGPDCGVCLDAFHINIEEKDPLQAIRDVGSRLATFHVADNNRMPAGHGTWNWQELIDTLRSVGYDGALTAEFVAPIDRTPDAACR